MDNFFTYKDSEHIRDFDPIRNYVNMTALYLTRMTGRDFDFCKKYIVAKMRSNNETFSLKDRKVRFLSREDQRDRVRKETTITEYIQSIRSNNRLMSPSWTCYCPSYVKESMYTGYINDTSKIRSAYKKAMFIAEQKNDEDGVKFNDGMQSSSKIDINSISGAALAPHTINCLPSLHPTLTSTCAASTTNANLNNEKLLAGNRLYLSYQMTLDEILTSCVKTDMNVLQETMNTYGLIYPDANQTMECVLKSTRKYWMDQHKEDKIFQLIERLTPLERAAFVYQGDLYHLDKLNPEVVQNFFLGFTKRVHNVLPMEEAEAVFKDVDNDVNILANLLCKEYLSGKTMNEVKSNNPEHYGEIAANIRMIEEHLQKYEGFIKGLLRPNFMNVGSNRMMVPNMLREAVLTSDTDSTIFTSQYWVKRFNGDIGFEDRHYNVGFTVSFLVNKTVYHKLALMSKNIGMEDKHLHTISMKNEYYFPTYVLTNKSKNYFAYINVREGNVYSKMKLEKKGVSLRSAKIPKGVMNRFDEWIKMLMNTIIEKQKIKLPDLFTIPYEVETEIKNNILSGKIDYYQSAQIKSADGYKLGDQAPAMVLDRLWHEVFAPKYGMAPPKPYSAVKLSTGLDTRRKINEWISTIEDQALKQRLINFIERENRTGLTMLYIPKLTIGFGTIPEEIVSVVDLNKQLMNVTSPFYVVLESFGFYLENPNNTTLIHKYWKPRATT